MSSSPPAPNVQVSVDTSEACLAKVSFTIPPEEFEKEYQGALRAAGRNVRMKGFRPGKVPPHVIEKRFGDEVRREVMERFLREAYDEAVTKEGLHPLSHPRVSPDEVSRDVDGGFSADFEVTLKPSFELPDYKGMVIESELEPVLPEQTDSTIEQLRRERSTPEPVGEEGLGEDGMAVCDVVFKHGDDVVLSREGMQLGVHTPPPGVEGEVFEKTLEGARPGDALQCEMTLPDFLEDEAVRGAAGTCEIHVHEAYDMVPPSDQELFELLEVEDMDSLKTKVREKLEEAAAKRERQRVEGALLDRLIEKTDLELPRQMLEEQTQHRLQSLAQEMAKQDVPRETIQQQLEEQRDTAREEAEKGMRALLVVEALGEKENLLVTNDELEAELQSIAERNQTTVEEVREYYVQQNLTQQMAIEVLERKVRAFLYENAEVKEPS